MESTKINARIVADSIDSRGNRITTYVLTYPRMIHAEVMTHRMFSRNAASSRAIPFDKMVKMIEKNPFVPIAWQKDHKGMQGTEYFEEAHEIDFLKMMWIDDSQIAIEKARNFSEFRLTKQLCNRLLEPFMWYTCLVTATEYDNFFELRCPKYHSPVDKDFLHKSKKDLIAAHSNPENLAMLDKFTILDWLKIDESGAEIHIQALAEAMWDARNDSTPKQLQPGEWHIPFGDSMDKKELMHLASKQVKEFDSKRHSMDDTLYSWDWDAMMQKYAVKIAIARCARLSYMTFDGEINYDKDIALFEQLFNSKHMSPFEHVAKCMSDIEYYSFIKGKYPTTEDQWGICNYELYPLVRKPIFDNDPIGENPYNGDKYGWCNNFKGFIPYRYMIENGID